MENKDYICVSAYPDDLLEDVKQFIAPEIAIKLIEAVYAINSWVSVDENGVEDASVTVTLKPTSISKDGEFLKCSDFFSFSIESGFKKSPLIVKK